MRFRKLVLLAFAASLAHGPACANPAGGAVVSGNAVFNNTGNLLTIANTPGTIINWQNFTILPGETTRFLQQGSSSAVLNRIVGQDPSQILGTLQSNGRVFLVNPNGVVFGAGAQVDVNGLVASTLNITNEDFLAGRGAFNAGSVAGNIRNDGAITTPAGGHVYLIAPSIENNGIITSPRGEVVLAAGRHVQLVDSGSPDLHVVVSAPDDRAVNLGQIIAQGGSVGIYGALVNQRGLVSADSAVQGEDGRIVFKASGEALLEAGSVTSARGAGQGGDIRILGDHVGLTGDARVDASGGTGGGTVLVGGDFHGANPAIANASAVYAGAQTTINADAIQSGDGGRIAVWSDGATRAYGQISARGGQRSGNGGFAEVSSRGYLDYRARTDLRASDGAAGTLLLDPNDITIQAAGVTDVPSSGSPLTYSGGPASSILTAADLQSQLALGGVTVSTAGGTGGSGNITVADPVGWNNGGTLSLIANNAIAINGAINASFDGRLLLNSGGTITQTAPINTTYLVISALGNVSLAAVNNVAVIAAQVGDGTHLNQNFTFVNGTGFLVSSLNGINGISVAATPGGGGVISLTATTGGISQLGGSILAGNAASLVADSISFPEANAVGVVAGRLNNGAPNDSFSFTSAGALNAGIAGGNSGIQAGGGSVTLLSPGAITGSVSGGSIALTAGNGITVTTQASSISASNSGGSAGINLTNTGALALQGVSEGGSGAVSIDNTGALTVAAGTSVASTTGSISLTAHSPLTVDGSVDSSGGGAITLSAGPSGSVTDKLTINGSVGTSAGLGVAVSTTGPILLRAGDSISATGAVAGAVTQQPFLNGAPPPGPPTIGQCTADPTIAGCSAVLPTVAQCTVTPTAPGCAVVLPTLAQCTATPALAGCGVVLPFLAACVTDPTIPGCSAVLPTFAACTANPATAGCSAILPSLATCIANPALAGCSAVLPPISACAANPGLPGCSAVLPTLAACTANPMIAGCSAILPSLTACIAAPGTAGCTAVLPTLTSCIGLPSLMGCSVVLPSLATCVSAPASSGCSVVLPSLATCASTPTAGGCSAVLPTLAQCTSTPTLQGCAVVLPPVNVCLSNPASAGCQVVLPPTQTASNSPVSQVLNNTVNIINTVTTTIAPTKAPTAFLTVGTTSGASGGSGSSGSSTTTASAPDTTKADDTKKDEKKEEKAADKSEAKNEPPPPKTFCN